MAQGGILEISDSVKPMRLPGSSLGRNLPEREVVAQCPRIEDSFFRALESQAERYGVPRGPDEKCGLKVMWEPLRHYFFLMQWCREFDMDKLEYELHFVQAFDFVEWDERQKKYRAIIPLTTRALAALEQAHVYSYTEQYAQAMKKKKSEWKDTVDHEIMPEAEHAIANPYQHPVHFDMSGKKAD